MGEPVELGLFGPEHDRVFVSEPTRPAPPPAPAPVQLALVGRDEVAPDPDQPPLALEIDTPRRRKMPPTTDAGVARALAKARARAAEQLARRLDRLDVDAQGAAERCRTAVDADGAVEVLRRVHQLAIMADEIRTAAVELALEHDASWAGIGSAVGMERGNAHNWHARRTAARDAQ